MIEAITRQVLNAMKQRNRLELATGATALQSLRAHAKLEARRIEAEDRAAHRALTGQDIGDGEDMGDVILGDNSSYVMQPTNQFGRLLGQAVLALAIGGPLAYVASQYLQKPPPSDIVDTDTDTVTTLKIVR